MEFITMAQTATNQSASVPEVKMMSAEVKRTLRKAWGNEDGANHFWLDGIAGYLEGIAVNGIIPANFHPEDQTHPDREQCEMMDGKVAEWLGETIAPGKGKRGRSRVSQVFSSVLLKSRPDYDGDDAIHGFLTVDLADNRTTANNGGNLVVNRSVVTERLLEKDFAFTAKAPAKKVGTCSESAGATVGKETAKRLANILKLVPVAGQIKATIIDPEDTAGKKKKKINAPLPVASQDDIIATACTLINKFNSDLLSDAGKALVKTS
tara:strand:+ start:52 stop:846 length:795 start_codon:yes stop_codon:yes gene_type:complete